MELGIIYRDLFQNPFRALNYRKLYYYYHNNEMEIEANAFAELLRLRFDKIIDEISDDPHELEE